MSESKKMSSPYAFLDNRPIDQWKVTELKEELKKRKLVTKGLKEELVKRLDEAVRAESENAKRNVDDGFDSIPQLEIQSEDATALPLVEKRSGDIMDHDDDRNEMCENANSVNMNKKLDSEYDDNRNTERDTDRVQVDVGLDSLAKETPLDGEVVGSTDSTGVEGSQVVHAVSVETSVVVSGSLVTEKALSGQNLQNIEIRKKSEDSNSQQEDWDLKPPHEEAKLNLSDLTSQVVEVSLVKSDCISIDNISITEQNELKDNVIADDAKLELDVKPEMVPPSSNNVVLDGGEFQLVDDDEPLEDKVTGEEKDVNNAEIADIGKKNDSGDVVSSEKLNLDRSSGDDSMEEDALESKQIDSKLSSDEVGDGSEKIEVPAVKEDGRIDAMVVDIPADKKIINIENKSDLPMVPVKRKLHEQAAAGNSETIKRQRRWNSEGLKVPESQSDDHLASTTPKDAFQSALKCNFSRSDSTASEEAPKERVVPPSPKPPTNSLRIDRFLRPFTLKAVQELLGKTGTVTCFWMDHIKTHCYVTYSSAEEAVQTRNAVYNLQWPANGGRLLVAEFVDLQEVKIRAEATPQPPATPVSTTPTLPPPPPTMQPPQPSPRLQVQRQQLPPPPPLLPPPRLSNPPPARERPLPSPPPLPEKVDPSIVTLDDLFRKTKATPRIYYLPLSDEQVAGKLKAQGKKQSSLQVFLLGRNCSGKGGGSGEAGSPMVSSFPRGLLWVEVETNLIP